MRIFSGLLILLFLLSGEYAIGQIIDWKVNSGKVSIIPKARYLRDPDGTLRFDDVKKRENSFLPFEKPVLSFGFDKSWYWLHFQINNPTSDSLVLAFEHGFIPYAELFYLNDSGSLIVQKAGYKVPLQDKPVTDHHQVFRLLPGNHEYYVHILPLVHAVPVRVMTLQSWQLNTVRRNIGYGVFSGILFLVILINLYLFIAFRKGYYLIYAILLFLYICTSAFVMEGYGIYLFNGIDLMFWYKMIPAMDMPALLGYAITFLNLKSHNKRLWRMSLVVLVFFIFHIVVLIYTPLIPALLINQVFAMGVFILASRIGIVTGKSGNRLGYYFAFAYFIWFLLILIEAIYIQTGRPSHFSALSYVSFAVFVESLLLALLLVIRFQWEKKADLKKQTELEHQVEKIKQELENEFLNARLEIQEQTFQHISQEIHDNIGQSLILAKLNVGKARDKADPENEDRLQTSHKLISEAIYQLRDLSKSFNTNHIQETGLSSAIGQQLMILKKSGSFTIDYADETIDIKKNPQRDLLLFRVIQELLNNIVKHAEADHISVFLKQDNNELVITVSDNGKGFNPDAQLKETAKGLGLRNMANRLNLINGKMNIKSQPGSGTTTSIIVSL